MVENNKNRESRLIGKDVLSLLKKYVPLLFLSVVSVNSFSQANNTKTARQEIQIVTVSGNDKKSEYKEGKNYVLEDYPDRKSINLNCIVADYWSHKPIEGIFTEGLTKSGYPEPHFAEYKFYNDSTFKNKSGYWEGASSTQGFAGKYELDNLKKVILFDVTDFYWRNDNDPRPQIPLGMRMLEVTDSTVTFSPIDKRKPDAKEKAISMYRHPGCVATQQWEWEDGCGGRYSLYFTDNGLFEYWANQLVKVDDIDEYLFQGQYHLHNNVLYLNVQKIIAGYIDESKGTRVMTFGSGQHTYVRLNLPKGLIHSADLDALHNANIADRDWVYEDCEYITQFPIVDLENEEWMEMTKVEIKED